MGSGRSSSTPTGSRRTPRLLGTLLVATLLAGCTSGGDDATPATSTSSVPGTNADTGPGSPDSSFDAATSLGIRLSQGEALAAQGTPLALVDGEPLDDAAVQAVIDRLPAWNADADLAEPFAWPAESLAPPRAGATVEAPFPAAETATPEVAPTGPLTVTRFQPEGDVAIAPFVTITFDQPMVALGTVGQVADAAVPATISPAVPGTWQWIGTRTLRFDAASDVIDRLPMATDYRVVVPSGTVSATGGALADEFAFEFSTPPVTIRSISPLGQSLPLEPLFVAVFDQRIEAAAVLAELTLVADGDTRAVRPATADEIAADEAATATTSAAPDGRWLAFRPVDPLPADAPVTITFGAGTPSAEGPRTTDEAVGFEARTYPPLRVLRTGCDFGSDCAPGAGLYLEFTNPLDPTGFDPATIGVRPEIPGAVTSVTPEGISIRGTTEARTTYEVTVPAELTDVYGQTLGRAVTESFEIDAADPRLDPFVRPLTTLDPSVDGATLTVRSVNHDELRVRIFSVEPGDWDTFQRYYFAAVANGERDVDLPDWTELSDDAVAIAGADDRLAETAIALDDALDGTPGHLVVIVEPTEPYLPSNDLYWSNRPTMTWVQSTSIGLDAFADDRSAVVWTTDLQSGAPLAGVTVGFDGADEATTAGDGLAELRLAAPGHQLIVARLGQDTALLPAGYYGDVYQPGTTSDEARWYVFDDRQVYRPGETVSVKGWIRRLALSDDGRLGLPEPGARITYVVHDPQYVELTTGTAGVSAAGGFDLSFELPDGANLGGASIDLTVDGMPGLAYAGYTHGFQIQEFRNPEFEVTARTETPDPHLSSRPATVAVDAAYYAGGPLGSAPVAWQVTTSSATYSPPGHDGFSFGEWTPWWSSVGGREALDYSSEPCCGPSPFGEEPEIEEFSGTTDAAGSHYLQIDFGDAEGERPDLPVAVTSNATVTDVNRQAWAASTDLLVHPAELYVGLRSDRTFVRRGDPMVIEVITTDIAGAEVAGRTLDVTAARLESTYVEGEWTEVEMDPQTCAVTTTDQPFRCEFTTEVGGSYRVRAVVTDDDGGRNRTELTVWVSGSDAVPSRSVEQESLTIVPDRAEYEVGTSASLLVQAPFAGEGLAMITRAGIVETKRFTATDGSAMLDIPITDAAVPGLDVTIEVVGRTARTADDGTPIAGAPNRPAFATGSITLPVSTATRTLEVTAVPRAATLEPGGATALDVTVTGPDGTPVAGAELAVVVVDEAVLAVGGAELPDPIDVFYGPSFTYLFARYGRESVELPDPATLAGEGTDESAGGAETTAAASEESADAAGAPAEAVGDGAADFDSSRATGEAGGPAISERTDFGALAVFAPDVTTDAAGAAVVDVPLPDNLTRYRVMVVAAEGEDEFGSAESSITARLPLMVRPSAPRFANFGDTFELPVVVQNQTDQPMDVDLVLQTANLRLDGPAGRRVTVPADDRVEVRFAVAAADAGTARFRVAGVSGDAADAATVELPVYTPAAVEAFATYGVLDEGTTVQPVLAPDGVIPEFGGLEITTSSTSLQALTDAVLYLSEYPFRSSDAFASRIMAIASLRDVLEAFAVEGLPSAEALDAAVAADVAGLAALQNGDGGFPFWTPGRPSEPYNTIQATHALVLAEQQGYAVPDQTLGAALAYLTAIDQYYPPEYGEDVRDTLSAYALHVRQLAGDTDPDTAQSIWDRRGDELQLDAIAWLWPVVTDPATAEEMGRLIANRAVETAGAANFATSYGDDAYVLLHSDRRTDGIVLDALIAERPDSDLIPKVVAGLLGGQTTGRWENVQENAFILLALQRYFETYEAQTPDFVARIWLGDRFAGDQTFAGRSTDRVRITVPTAELVAAGDTELVVAKEGSGRLYYRLGLRTAPADLVLDPLDRGFVVARTYEAVDDPADVTRDADGTWRIRAGATVRVRLTMVAESQRTHAALVDPLPAGLEILNPALATTPDLPPDENSATGFTDAWWTPTWFDHQNQRDDRAEAFASWLPAGAYDYSYVARATTPGTFVVPPTRAEEIYAPETFGRGATDRVVIG